jgi:8-oxo-dGTP pyrophosphatase MutT (NUDIX family)
MAPEPEFRVRAAGILVGLGHVLLESLADREVWGIPGGGLETDETLEETCRREFEEELGLHVSCDRLAVVVDGFYEDDAGVLRRELTFYFVISSDATVSPGTPIAGREPHLQFAWLPVAELEMHTVVPDYLPSLLRAIEESVEVRYVIVDPRPGRAALSASPMA